MQPEREISNTIQTPNGRTTANRFTSNCLDKVLTYLQASKLYNRCGLCENPFCHDARQTDTGSRNPGDHPQDSGRACARGRVRWSGVRSRKNRSPAFRRNADFRNPLRSGNKEPPGFPAGLADLLVVLHGPLLASDKRLHYPRAAGTGH